MPSRNRIPSVLRFAVLLAAIACSSPPRGPASGSDPRAVELAERVVERLGGERAWERTRYVTWRFFGGRRHLWDKHENRLRLETDELLVLLDLDTRDGRAFRVGEDGAAVELEGEERVAALEDAWATWINDSYWMFMPYKLLDPGVRLTWVGPTVLDDGRAATAIDLTFDGVGLTPQNRYRVHVADDTGLVERWDYYARAEDLEPKLVAPWAGWRRFGEVWLATDHGRGRDWAIEIPETVDARRFAQP